MKIFHHNDLDGRMAGALILEKFPNRGAVMAAFEVDYKDPFPFDVIGQDEEIFIVDFSLQKPGDWERLLEITDKIVWIDHHANASKPLKELRGIYDTSRCGAWLTYSYLYPASPVPSRIDLTDKWDRYIHNGNPVVLEFEAGTRLIGNDYRTLLSRPIELIRKDGKIILEYEKKRNKEFCEGFAHRIKWEGLTWLAVNNGMGGRSMFDGFDHDSAMMMYVFDGKTWEIHLYGDATDMGKLAKKYSGGGHVGAAGFQCKELPWRKK